MNALASFQFLQPLWLLLLPVLWIVIWIHLRQARRASIWTRLCDAHLLQHMMSTQGSNSSHAVPALILGSLLSIGVTAVAAPSWSSLAQPVMESPQARVIVLDLSRSMLVQDVRPSRFQHALAAANEVIGNGYQGETGLVVFAGSAFVLSPLSRDAATLLAFIEAMHPDAMPEDGSDLELAINKARDLLQASPDDQGQILLISSGDSDNTSESGERAVQAAFDAAAQDLRVSVLAIGTVAGGPLLDQKGGLVRNSDGQVRISKTDFELLNRIAEAGEGALRVVNGNGISGDLLSSRLDASALVESSRQRRDRSAGDAADDGVWVVWLMLPLLLILFRRNMFFVLFVAVLMQSGQESFAADETSTETSRFWSHRETVAFNAYQQGNYNLAGNVSNRPMLRGASFYRSGQFQQALEQFNEDDSAASLYNLANTLVQLERYPEALARYQQVLDLDPGFESARYNKRLLELFIVQQAEADSPGQEITSEKGADGEIPTEDALEMLIGIATELQPNPADEQQPGPGSGASHEGGQVDPLERFDGREVAPERFVLRAQSPDQTPDSTFIERWISSLPETSSEMYRRKFLRDLRRQQRQPR